MLRALLLFVVVLVAAPTAAEAARKAPCIPGDKGSPTCTWWNAKVTLVADGDTIEAKIAGVGKEQVRFTGINAMEIRKYTRKPSQRRGACHATEAAAFVDRFIKRGDTVRLAAQNPASRSGRRLRRSVWAKSGGKWVDVSRLEVEAGHALWLPNDVEDVHNAEYARLAGAAIGAGRNLYDPDACGAGPSPEASVRLVINWDADGGDEKNLNGEWVDVYNTGRAPLDLSGWWLRDSALRYAGKTPGYPFKPGTVVPAGGRLRLHVGCGNDSGEDRHWCTKETVFENVQDAKGAGDGAYLFDPQGDLRVSSIYPCLVACEAPLRGNVRMDVQPSGTESVTITNTSNGTLDLGAHVLKLRSRGVPNKFVYGVLFPLGTEIRPGGSYRYTPPTPKRYADNGGVVELRTADDQLVECSAWGFGKC